MKMAKSCLKLNGRNKMKIQYSEKAGMQYRLKSQKSLALKQGDG